MADTSPDIPLVMGPSGAVPTPPATLRDQLVAIATALAPGLTTNLPGSLIEDITSTQVAGLSLIDQARVELVNSLTPYAANLFLLQQLGNIYLGQGAPNPATNTSVAVVFSGPSGFVIADGFVVSDGSFQYVVQSGGIIGSNGSSLPLVAIANQSGSWAVPQNTVTQLITSVPSGINLSVTNPQPGTPGTAAETESDYRARILQAGLASATGMGRFLKTLLLQVPNVNPRSVGVRQANGGWEVLCAGGDQYQIAYAIWRSLFDINMLAPSVIGITGITKSLAPPAAPVLTANTSGGSLPTETVWVVVTYVGSPGETEHSSPTSVSVTGPNGQVVVTSPAAETGAVGYNVYAANQNIASAWVLQNTSPISIGTNFSIDTLVTGTAVAPTANTTGIVTTNITHQYTTGQQVTITGANPSSYNGTFTVTVYTPNTFSTGVDTSSFAAWVSGGVCTPNSRNVTVYINDYPDTYQIQYVNPPQQTVSIVATWNTIEPNFVGGAAVAQLAQAALVNYINSIGVGQPILVYQLEETFQQAVVSILPPNLLTRMVFSVSLNGVSVSPEPGTGIIPTDPESFLYTTASNVTVIQG